VYSQPVLFFLFYCFVLGERSEHSRFIIALKPAGRNEMAQFAGLSIPGLQTDLNFLKGVQARQTY